MSLIISATLSYILFYKYIALFVIAYLAALLLPLPSNTSLLAAGAFASQGYMDIYIVLLVAFLANILGDLTGFIISRLYGKEFLMKIGLKKMMLSKKYTDIEKFIFKNSRMTIFVTRFFGQIGPLVNILAGLSQEISFKRFFIYGSAGEFVYAVGLGLIGYFLGSTWQNLSPVITPIGIGFTIIVIIFVFSKLYTRKSRE